MGGGHVFAFKVEVVVLSHSKILIGAWSLEAGSELRAAVSDRIAGYRARSTGNCLFPRAETASAFENAAVSEC